MLLHSKFINFNSLVLSLVFSSVLSTEKSNEKFFLEEKIIGGQPAKLLSWPWQAYIVITYKTIKGILSLQCGGALITNDSVITAAHCFRDFNGTKYSDAFIILGENDLIKNETTEIIVQMKKLITADESHDIALVKLSRKINLNGNESYIRTLNLPESFWNLDCSNCYVTGWGKISEQSNSSTTILRQAKVKIISDVLCMMIYRRQIDIRKSLCAGYLDGHADTCQGDSGGPLQCRQRNGNWVLIGITSNGLGCGRKGFPGIYTRVFHYLKWIYQNYQ